MTLVTRWISVLMVFLLLSHFWRSKVYASGNSEEEIDFTYVIIGVTLGVFLAIGLIAVIICMIKDQMIENVFGESDGKMDRRFPPINHTAIPNPSGNSQPEPLSDNQDTTPSRSERSTGIHSADISFSA